MPEFNRWKQCRFGVMVYNVNDRYVGRSFDLYGEFSWGESDLFRQVVRSGDVVVDVGANIGAHTLQFAQLTGPTGRVYAFEPQRLAFQTLCANMALNNVTNAYCFQQAVGRQPGTVLVPFLDPSTSVNFGGLSLVDARRGDRVPVTTIDALDLTACRLIKVDVEGMELDVLRGALTTVHRARPILYVENDREAKSDELLHSLAALDYDLFWHRPPLYNPQNFAGNAENVFKGIVSVNVVGVPKQEPMVMQGFIPITPTPIADPDSGPPGR
jgi:FkbM family methyltransferase